MKPRRIPRVLVDFRGRAWALVLATPETDARLLITEHGEHYACADADTREIVLNTNKPRSTWAASFFHEVVHVSFIGTGALNPAPEERLVVALEANLWPMLRRAGLSWPWMKRVPAKRKGTA